jgi:hypothetical protein
MSKSDFNDVVQAVKLFEAYEWPWAVCGGRAIDLYLNRVTRPHKDVDFAVLRRDQLVIQDYFSSRGWTLEKAAGGQLVPWHPGEWIDLPVHVIWCKNTHASPDFVELLFNEVDEVSFLYRRDASITLPLDKMMILSSSGIPILAPEIVLLYKSVKPEDDTAAADFRNVLPNLSQQANHWLAAALRRLQPDHSWLKDLYKSGENHV